MRRLGTSIQRVLIGAVVMIALGATASQAEAAQVSAVDGVIRFEGAPGEDNYVALDLDRLNGIPEPSIYLAKPSPAPGAPIVPGPGCVLDGGAIRCPLTGITRIDVQFGDGNDTLAWGNDLFEEYATLPVFVAGGDGDDTIGIDDPYDPGVNSFGVHPVEIDAGAGEDTIFGSAVDDTIIIADGAPDTVSCSGGIDVVSADAADVIPGDCEERAGTAERPAGPDGITINNGAKFTNNPAVIVSTRWPRFAGLVLLSNGAAFGAPQPFTVAATVPWTLVTSGPERQPRTVFAQFQGGDSGPDTYQDSIVLDRTRPRVRSAVIKGGRRAFRPGRMLTVKTRAADATSGVKGIQVVSKKQAAPQEFKAFKRKLKVAIAAKLFVRVQDGAGNVSPFRRVKVKR